MAFGIENRDRSSIGFIIGDHQYKNNYLSLLDKDKFSQEEKAYYKLRNYEEI